MKNNFKIYLLLILLFASSCKEKITDTPAGNAPPQTGLFLYPDSTISRQPSTIKIHWWGDDPDGLITGFYFSWDGKKWTFTASNDSLFALQIGISDTTYTFKVSASDNGGNGVYDKDIFQNGIDYGPEHFTDLNGNGVYDTGEPFIDIGLIDPTPAELKFPIKNSAPNIYWNELSVLPDTSFPVMSFGFEASDIDGDETIQSINIALNDTLNPENIVKLKGSVRRITLRTKEFNSPNPLTEILIDGQESNIAQSKLPGIKLNGSNKLYVQAEDISGAKSDFIVLPGSGKTWYVKKPKGKLLIVDDYNTFDNAASFYNSMFDSLGFSGKFDTYDYLNQKPPYLNVTFQETIKLFDYVLWYSDNNPSLDLAAAVTQKYISAGGKIAFSMQFPQNLDLSLVFGFLPIIPDSSGFALSLLPGVKISADTTQPGYPPLQTSSNLFRVRTFYLSALGSIPVYYYPDKQLPGYAGFTDSEKKLFFISVPLHKANAGAANVKKLLYKVFIQDFGLTQ